MSWLVQKFLNVAAGMTVPGFYKNSKIYSAYTISTDLCLLGFTIGFFKGAMVEELLFDQIFAFAASIYCCQILTLTIYARWTNDRLVNLVEHCTPYPGETLSPDFSVTPRILPYVMNACLTVSCVAWDFYPLLPFLEGSNGKRRLAVPTVFPFSYQESPYFEFAVFLQAVSGFYVGAKTAAFYDFFVNVGARLVAKYFYLRNQMLYIVKDKENISANLREWIRKHQHITRFGVEFQQTFSIGLLILFTFESVELCLAVYVWTTAKLDIMPRIFCTCYVFGVFLKLFIVTRCGDHITHESSRIMEDGFGAAWYELPLEAQNVLKVVICRAKNKINITAMNVVPLNTNTFRSIVMSAYSYYTILAEFR